MFHAIGWMLLTGVVWTVVGAIFGKAPSEKGRLYTFFALYGAVFTASVYGLRPPPPAPAGEVFRLSLLIVPSAFMEAVSFLLRKRAMERGRQGIAWCAVQRAMVVPFLCSVAFLRSPASAAQWAGLALVLASFALFGLGKPEQGGGSNDGTYFRLVLVSFALIGVALFLRLLPGHVGLSQEALAWRLPIQAPAGMVFWLAVCLAKRLWSPGAVWRHALPYGIVVAIGQICFYFAIDAADRLRLTSIVTPVAIGTNILLFTLYCRFFRGERLSRVGWSAVAMDIGGIALLSCR